MRVRYDARRDRDGTNAARAYVSGLILLHIALD